jgi:hypothetical protein
VPSLLTRGEFVLSQNALAGAGAMALQRFNQGGLVAKGFAEGGGVAPAQSGASPASLDMSTEAQQAMRQLAGFLTQFGSVVGSFAAAAQALNTSFNGCVGSSQALAKPLESIPKSLTVTGTHTVSRRERSRSYERASAKHLAFSDGRQLSFGKYLPYTVGGGWRPDWKWGSLDVTDALLAPSASMAGWRSLAFVNNAL